MNRIYASIIAMLLLFGVNSIGFAQGPTCSAAEQICGSIPPFPANTTGGTAIGSIPTSIGCLGSTPNESWFFFEVTQAGTVTGSISNSAGVDIDGAIFGPFTSITNACANLTAANIVACDYGGSGNVPFNFSASVGIYAVLITNFSGSATNISIGFSSGNNLVCCISAEGDYAICEGEPSQDLTGAHLSGSCPPESFTSTCMTNTPATTGSYTTSTTTSVNATCTISGVPAGATITNISYEIKGNAISPSWCNELRVNVAAPNTTFNLSGGSISGATSTACTLSTFTTVGAWNGTSTNSPNGTYTFSFYETSNDGAGNQDFSVSMVQVIVTYNLGGTTQLTWFNVPMGGTALGTGTTFDPVGVAGSGLADTNSPGVYTFYVGCGDAGCRAPVTITIYDKPVITSATAICQADETVTITIIADPITPLPVGCHWEYSFNNGSTWGISNTLAGVSPGTPDITVLVRNSCDITNCQVMQIVAIPAICAACTPQMPTGSITFTESSCLPVCVLGGGTIQSNTLACPSGQTLEYSTDGITYSGIVPSYNQNNSITIYARCSCEAGIESAPVSFVTSPGTCTDPVAPTTAEIINSTCSGACAVSGGSFNITGCGVGTTLTFFTDGTGSTTTTAPTYNQTGPAQTVYFACVDDASGCKSVIQSLTTSPGVCLNPLGPTTAEVINSTCSGSCVVSGGSFNITGCSAGTTLTFYTDGTGTTTATAPIYNQTGPAQIVYFACVDDVSGCKSPIQSLTTVPGTCPDQPVVSTVNSCVSGGIVTFSQIGGLAGIWTVSGGGTIDAATGDFTPSASGCFSATYTNTLDGCSGVANFVVFPSEPVLTAPANTCNAAFVLPVVTPVVGFTVQYSINGGAWATAPAIPTTPGCHTIAARYVNTAACGLTAALTPSAITGCDASADVSVLIYPSEPVLTAPANTCNAAFVLPAVTPVVGFTVQYSINGGAWATAPAIPTTPGCHTIAARYVNTAACGSTAALTPSTIAGCDASADVTVLIYPSEPVLTAPANTCNAAFVLPAVTPVVGFTVQYSINGGAWATAPAIPTTPGCHTIAARYVNTAACGFTAALSPSAIAGCDASADVSVLIYPSEPVLTAPTNTCNAAFVLPVVTPVVGFTVQYSINSGAWATAPTIPTTPGCHTIAARYVNTAACGLTAALTPSAIAGCDASADVSVLIYPSEPVLTAPTNTCNAAFVLPAVTPVVGFTVQYSINSGAWATAPTIPTTPGCHTIAARYVNTAACGLTAALTPSAIAGCDASADVSVLIYPSEPVLTAPTNTCNAAFVLPAVTPVVGFTVQYSINGGTWATAPAIPTTPGCHTIAARFVNTAACGSTAALTPSAITGCDASADVSVLIYPSEPVLTAPVNTCNTAFVLPAVTPVVGFTVQYSINGGAWATAPTIPTTPGCHAIAARYVNTAACGLTAALTPSAIAGCDASAMVSVVIFPSAPVITMPRASCMSDFILPAVPPVAGFSIQYSINGGAWTANPMTSMVPGCYSIQARYVLETACGTTLAGTAGTGSCGASNMVNTNVYPVPVIEPVADVFMCDMSQVNVTFSSLTEILSCYGGASIQYQWTNNNTSIGLAASGTGNISFIATQPGTAFIIVTPVFTGPDGSCKGQPISFIISIHQEISIVCNDRVHVSLDENCEFNMSGDFILEGSYNEYFYNVVIKTSTGEIIDNSNVTLHIGEVLIAEVTDICNGNRCWGEVIFEDKLAPVVECNCSVPSEDCTFNCYDLAVIQNETVPMLYGVSPNKSVLTTPPTATDGCGPVSATFTDAINGGDQCDTRELVRSWTFEDVSGNKSYCTQRFAFEPISVTDLIPPVREVHLTCGLDATPAAIAGYLDVDSRTQPASATNIGAYADDYAQTGSVVELHEGYANGYFTYNQIGYDGKLHAQKVDNNVCNLYTTYTDDVIPACGIGCSGNMKVIRNWKLLDWCTGEVYTYTQVIKATDEKAPTFTVKNATVGVDPWGCAANWNVGQPWELADNCAKAEEIKWGVKVPSGVTLSGTAPNYRITGLTKGTHKITYWASDCCGNVSEKDAYVTVIDASAPVAVAKQNIVMSLTGSGTGADGAGKIYGWQIDNGSYDHCSDVRFEVRRVDGGSCGNVGANGTHNNNSTYNDNNGYPSEVPGAVWFHPQDNAQDTDGGAFVKFCCDDIPAGADYGLHDVELRVWDDGNMNGIVGDNDIIDGMKDNYNTTWVTIRVENKLPPALVCPPDVTITCDMELNLSLDAETNVNDVNLTMTGYPQAYDLCSNLQVTYKDQWVGTHDAVCKSGTVRRTFKVTKGAVVVTCAQFITVSTITVPFTVTFPGQNQTDAWDKCSFTLEDARDAANATIKRPIVNYGQCDIVGENITIDTFLFEDGACKKWRVKYSYKNWCTGEEINTIGGLPIVHWYAFKDVTAPVLSCTNQMFAANPNPQNPNGGCEAAVALEASASDKLICAEESWIKWQMFFDGWNDGTVDRLGSSFVNKSWNGIWVPQAKYIANVLNPTWVALQDQHPNLPLADLVYVTYIKPTAASGGTAKLPVGTGATAFILNAENISHKVLWKVTDGCGNVDQCESTVMVVDKKAPTPYCVSVSTALMQTNPQMVELWARDFDKGAFDNCTPQSKLYFTFDGAAPIYSRVNDEHYYKVVGGVSVNATAAEYAQGKAYRWLPTSRSAGFVWTAAGDYNVQVSVWDEAWNTDYCTVILSVRGGNGSRVSGTVATASGQGVNDVTVEFATNAPEYPKTSQTLVNGTFGEEHPNGFNYTVKAAKNSDYLNGVSTLDLVMIQRHILGLQALDSNYKLIAADANNDGKVTASDLTDLRKLILGVTTTFPNASWRFPVTGTAVQTSPIKFTEAISITNLSSEMDNQNFVAVKIGDVNGNVSTSVNSPEVESRSNANVEMSVAEAAIAAGEVVEIPVTAANFSEVSGFQYTMNLNGASFVGVQSGVLEVNANNVGVISDHVVTMSYASTEAVNANEGAVLFTLTVKADKAMKVSEMISLNSEVTRAESYNSDLKVGIVSLGVRTAPVAGIELFQNEPNPFKGMTTVSFEMPEAATATLSVYDVTGKVVTIRNINAIKGLNSEIFTKDQLGVSGVLYYTLVSGDFTATKKMIIVE